MSSLLVALIAGIGAGALYAMLGQGIVVAFRGSGVINFGHGAVAGYTAYSSTNFEKQEVYIYLGLTPSQSLVSSKLFASITYRLELTSLTTLRSQTNLT